jgi:hypothetical protein
MNTVYLSIIVFLNVTLLAILVPGGPIENRDFSALKGFVFWGFNVFLITLGLTSFYTIYTILANDSTAILLTKFISISYIVVYAIDLIGMFPKSPTKMSNTLMLFEIINLCIAVYLLVLSFFIQ